MKIQIKNRFTGSVIFDCEAESLKSAVERAIRNATDLSGADLSGANGIISFTGMKHLAVAWKHEKEVMIKIGCKELSAKNWLISFEEIGKKEEYREKEIELYGCFIKMALILE